MPGIAEMLAADPSLAEKMRRGRAPEAAPAEQLQQMPSPADPNARPATMPIMYPQASPSTTPTAEPPPSFADRPEDVAKTSPPMSIQYGGMDPALMSASAQPGGATGQASASAMQQFANQMGAGSSSLVPATQLGARQGPSYGSNPLMPLTVPGGTVAPAGSGDPVKDRLMAMLDAPSPSSVTVSGGWGPGYRIDPSAADLIGHQQRIQTLSDLMKSQNEQQLQQAHLALEDRKVRVAEAEAGPVGSANRQYAGAKARHESALQARGIMAGTPAFAAEMAKFEDANPEPKNIAPGPGPGGVVPKAGVMPAGQPPVAAPSADAGVSESRKKGFTAEGVPLDLQTLMNKDAGDLKQTPLQSFMTQFYQGVQSHPDWNNPKTLDKVIAQMKEQYGADKVDQALQPGRFLGADSGAMQNAYHQILRNITGDKAGYEASQADERAKAAIRNQMAGNPVGGAPGNQRLPESLLERASKDVMSLPRNALEGLATPFDPARRAAFMGGLNEMFTPDPQTDQYSPLAKFFRSDMLK